jgi:hypothetical protein
MSNFTRQQETGDTGGIPPRRLDKMCKVRKLTLHKGKLLIADNLINKFYEPNQANRAEMAS